jgi:phosphatidylglycerophosphatase A
VTAAERPIPGNRRFGLPAGHPAVPIATGFGVGLVPFAPGTSASLASLLLGTTIRALWGIPVLAGAALLSFVVGWWAAGIVAKGSGVRDPAAIVIDEITGQLLVLLATPQSLAGGTLAFLAFRLFDIWKPWPVGWADRHIAGGFGIMLDDLLAAGYAVASLWLARKIGSVLG